MRQVGNHFQIDICSISAQQPDFEQPIAIYAADIGMAYVPMNRTRALIICSRPQDLSPARLPEAARYLLDRKDATEESARSYPVEDRTNLEVHGLETAEGTHCQK